MRRALLLALSALLALAAACENPFDPIDKSDEIRGLSYVDFSLTWDRWDSDPEADGVVVTPEYFNEFGDSLSFHDKPHRVVVEFWTQANVGGETNPDTGDVVGGRPTSGSLFFSFPLEYGFSDDEIRVPREAYEGAMVAAGYNLTGERNEDGVLQDAVPQTAFVILRVFPPKGLPQAELVAYYPDQTIWEPEPAVILPEALNES